MRKFIWLIVGIPLAVVLIVFSVVNRQSVRMFFSPFEEPELAFYVDLPFFVFLFAALLVGMVIGGLAVWFSQGQYRREARRERARADNLARQTQAQDTVRSLLPAESDKAA